MISKQQVVMHRTRTNIEDVKFAESFGERVNPRWLLLLTHDWADMGSPEVITVTVMPGDLLNDEPS